jgi:hypothetical protein
MTHTKDEAQPAPVQDPWQPIASAPKDGTRILCKDVEGFVDICEWTPDASGGRFTSSDDRTFGGGPAYTSWMSLPQPIQSTPPAAQPAQQEPINVAQAYAMAQVCLDLHDALGCKWGDNPYLAIDRLKTAAQPAPTVQEPVALTDEQAEFESVFKLPSNCTKFQGGYAPTSYNAWEAQTFCARWEGWKARSAHGITAAPEK